jgi:hypothetical protein
MKPLLVGEDNPYSVDDPVRSQRYALYPLPQNSAGGRLCALVMALTIKEYIGKFDRANLCDGRWSMKKARLRAALLLHDRGRGSSADYGYGQHDVFVLPRARAARRVRQDRREHLARRAGRDALGGERLVVDAGCEITMSAIEFVEWVRRSQGPVLVERQAFPLMRMDGALLEIVDVWNDGPMVRPRGTREQPTHLVMDLAELDVLRN